MYGLHKTILVLVTLLCWGISFIFKVDYSIIASEGITIISIILAIYMTSFSSLVSSKLADKMSKTQDKQLQGVVYNGSKMIEDIHRPTQLPQAA